MKTLRLLFLFSFIFLIWSCQKDNDGTPPKYVGQYLKSYEKVKSYSKESAQSLLTFASLQYPELATVADKIVSGVDVYTIEYESEYTNGNSILLSGIVISPNSLGHEALLLSFQNGTIVKNTSAPSVDLSDPIKSILHVVAGMGMVICIPDNIGFGSSTDYMHPYLCKSLFQSTIVDMIKAVDEMDQNNILPVALSGDLYLSGYSLGGWASLVAHKKIEDSPLTGFNLIGSSCGAGSYDLVEMKDYIFQSTDFVEPFYVPYIITGFMSAGEIPESNLSLYFNSPYSDVIPSLFDRQHSSDQINEQLTPNMQELLNSELIQGFDADPNYQPLKQALINNSQYAWINEKPIHLYHGTNDIHVPYSISVNTYQAFVNLGQGPDKIKFTPLEGKDHTSGVIPMYVHVLDEISDVLQ